MRGIDKIDKIDKIDRFDMFDMFDMIDMIYKSDKLFLEVADVTAEAGILES